MQSPSRWINLSGAVNVRDLGGYKAESGITRWNKLIRADNLHRLTEADQGILLDAGVRMIIDLRHGNELISAPNVFANHSQIHYVNIPIFRQTPPIAQTDTVSDLPTVFRYMVENCKEGFGEALSAIADADEGTVLYHCTAGKDRTGVLTALVLRLVGVAADDVSEDFALTTLAMARLRPVILEQVKQTGGNTEQVERLLSSESADMDALLMYIDDHYGDIFNYVYTLGLTDTLIDRIRTRLLTSQ